MLQRGLDPNYHDDKSGGSSLLLLNLEINFFRILLLHHYFLTSPLGNKMMAIFQLIFILCIMKAHAKLEDGSCYTLFYRTGPKTATISFLFSFLFFVIKKHLTKSKHGSAIKATVLLRVILVLSPLCP